MVSSVVFVALQLMYQHANVGNLTTSVDSESEVPSNPVERGQWRIQRGIQGCTGTPLLATPSTKKYTDDR